MNTTNKKERKKRKKRKETQQCCNGFINLSGNKCTVAFVNGAPACEHSPLGPESEEDEYDKEMRLDSYCSGYEYYCGNKKLGYISKCPECKADMAESDNDPDLEPYQSICENGHEIDLLCGCKEPFAKVCIFKRCRELLVFNKCPSHHDQNYSTPIRSE